MTQSMARNHHFSIQVCMAPADQDPSHTYHFQRTPTTATTPAAVPLAFPQAPHLPSPLPLLFLPQMGRMPIFQLVPETRQQTDLLLGLAVPLSRPRIAPILPLQSFAMITVPKARNADYAVNPHSRGAVGDAVAPCTGQLCPLLGCLWDHTGGKRWQEHLSSVRSLASFPRTQHV